MLKRLVRPLQTTTTKGIILIRVAVLTAILELTRSSKADSVMLAIDRIHKLAYWLNFGASISMSGE